VLEKDKRWVNKKYTNWVATLPCCYCTMDDGTVVAHHLKHIDFPWGGGGTGLKAHDWLTMPLCYTCHTNVHNGDRNVIEHQRVMIWKTQREAFNQGVLEYVDK